MTTFEVLTPFNEIKEITIIYADSLFSGYGHRKITVEVEYNNNFKKFSSVTNCMPLCDKASDLEGQRKYEALYDIIASNIEERIINWIIDVDDEEYESEQENN